MTRFSTLLAGGALAFGALLQAGTAQAHAVFVQDEAEAGAGFRAVLAIGHGCDGAATTAVRVRIPEGVIAVRPQPKPGWTLETVIGPYAERYEYYGQTLTEGVTEIVWSGGLLPDEWYDEFLFRARMPAVPEGTVIYFPVVQECTEGAHRWIELPAEGQDPHDLPEPAPGVTIIAPAGGH